MHDMMSFMASSARTRRFMDAGDPNTVMVYGHKLGRQVRAIPVSLTGLLTLIAEPETKGFDFLRVTGAPSMIRLEWLERRTSIVNTVPITNRAVDGSGTRNLMCEVMQSVPSGDGYSIVWHKTTLLSELSRYQSRGSYRFDGISTTLGDVRVLASDESWFPAFTCWQGNEHNLNARQVCYSPHGLSIQASALRSMDYWED